MIGAGAVVPQSPDDLAIVVDAMRRGGAVHRVIDRGEKAAAIEKGMGDTAGVIGADDLAQIVDAVSNGATRAQGIVDGGEAVGVLVVEEAVLVESGVVVEPDHLVRRVDAIGIGAAGAQGIVEGQKDIAAKPDEAVGAGAIDEISRDVVQAIDAECKGAVGGKDVVEADIAGAGAQKEAVITVRVVIPGDVPRIVDA